MSNFRFLTVFDRSDKFLGEIQSSLLKYYAFAKVVGKNSMETNGRWKKEIRAENQILFSKKLSRNSKKKTFALAKSFLTTYDEFTSK